jgi:hypothetical protein
MGSPLLRLHWEIGDFDCRAIGALGVRDTVADDGMSSVGCHCSIQWAENGIC